MNKKELTKKLMNRMTDFGYFPSFTNVKIFIREYEKLVFSVEPKNMRLKDIIKKMKDLSDNTRAEWIDGILQEFGNGFGSKKWREGYEQGKFEGAWVGNQLKDADKIRRELNRPVVPQFVADWIEYCKFTNVNLKNALLVGDVYFYNYANQKDFSKLKEFLDTENNQGTFACAWLDGYEVEKEKRYTVVMKYTKQPLYYNAVSKKMFFSMGELVTSFTRKELEDAGFGWIFSCEGMEVEEAEE